MRQRSFDSRTIIDTNEFIMFFALLTVYLQYLVFPVSLRRREKRKSLLSVVRRQIFRLSENDGARHETIGGAIFRSNHNGKLSVRGGVKEESFKLTSMSHAGDRNGGTSREDGGKVLHEGSQETALQPL